MELRNLITFRTVAEVNGFTRAAEQLGYAQSSVTAQIQNLEEELGVSLFDRMGKKIVLTEAGHKLLAYTISIIQLHDEAKQAIRPEARPSGVLTIGSPESLAAFRLPPLIQEYKQRFPQVKIVLKPGSCCQMGQMVKRGELDIAFLLEPTSEEDEELSVETIIQEALGLIASTNHHLLERNQEITIHDLQNETLLLPEAGCSYRSLLEQTMHHHHVQAESDFEFWSIEAIKSCVYAGLGITYLPLVTVRKELRERKLTLLPLDGLPDQIGMQIAYSKRRWMSPALREWIRFVHHYQSRWIHD